MQVDQIRNEMNKIECEQRMSDNFKTAETNAQLVEMRKAERQAEKEQNILLNKMHIFLFISYPKLYTSI